MKRIISLASIFGLLIVVWWLWSAGENDMPQQNPTSHTIVVRAIHTYRNGTHELNGTIPLPTPCHTLSHSVKTVSTQPERVQIAFTTKNMSEICAQVITPVSFSVSFEADENAIMTATLDEQPVELRFVGTPEEMGAAIDYSTSSPKKASSSNEQ